MSVDDVRVNMARADWKRVEERLRPPFGDVELQVGPYRLNLCIRLVTPMKYGIAAYVDGFFRGVYLCPESEIGALFYPLKTRRCVPKAKAEADFKRLKRVFGTADAKRLSGVDAVYKYRYPYWSTAKAVCRHLKSLTLPISIVESSEVL